MHTVCTYNVVTNGCPKGHGPYGITWPSTMVNMNATNNCRDGAGTYI